jgi:hypothetical protein
MPPVVGQPTVAAGDESDPAWVIQSVDMNGNVNADLSSMCDVDKITWTLNQPDTASFHFAKSFDRSTDTSWIEVLDADEIQIYRNGDLLFWGPVTGYQASAQNGQVDCTCTGVDYYLHRRFLDGPISNLLTNPSFASNLDSWTTVGATASIDTTEFIDDDRSAQLIGTGGDQYIEQIVNSPTNGVGLLMTLSGWFHIDSITAPPYQTRGLYIEAWHDGVFQGNNYYVIDTATPRNKWVKASCTIAVPPNTSWELHVRLYAPVGEVHWDDIKLVAMDSLSTSTLTGDTTTAVDIADIVALMVRHVQDTGFEKSHCFITADTATTGTKMFKAWQFVDHVQFDQGLQEFVLRGDASGLDYCVHLTPTTRTFRTFNPKRGTNRAATVQLLYDVLDPTDSNVAGYRLSQDGGKLVTRQTILGSDNGPDREQAEAIDTSSWTTVILEDVKQAPQGAEIASLQPLADEQIQRFAIRPLAFEVDVHGSEGFVSVVHPGDLVSCSVSDGFVQANNTYRIQSITLDRRKNLQTISLAFDLLS